MHISPVYNLNILKYTKHSNDHDMQTSKCAGEGSSLVSKPMTEHAHAKSKIGGTSGSTKWTLVQQKVKTKFQV